MPTFVENIRSGVPDEAWLNHLYKVLTEKDGVLQSTTVTYSGFLSHNQREEDVRPKTTVGVFPIFFDTVDYGHAETCNVCHQEGDSVCESWSGSSYRR